MELQFILELVENYKSNSQRLIILTELGLSSVLLS